MKWIGAHVSTAGGVENAPLNAADIGANAFALFTKNQRQWHAPQLTEDNINSFRENCKTFDYKPEQILPHDSYLINLGHPDQSKLQKSRMAFLEELQRCEQLGLVYLNFHPGTSLDLITAETCLDLIAESINFALERTKFITAVVENTAGQGASLGYKFEQLAYLISHVKQQHRIGICLDTCHLYAAGYDLKTQPGFTRT
ncbi:MAG: deoxyribonuclease IV, partial [Candidatus Cloacimonetes bacterium]|nr:deoxyribonuclease IV [Candidatus Cloacimonadota bacterium]